MSPRERFAVQYPGVFFLDKNRVAELSDYLTGEYIESVERAGEGNMNCTLRVVTSQRSLIVKQARPWVEKYPAVAAPSGRAFVEANFYREAQRQAASAVLPALLGFDARLYLLMLEDLGGARDFTFLYGGGPLSSCEIRSQALCLVDLHSLQVSPVLKTMFANRDMRSLNHEHIFDIPLRENNGLDLEAITPGPECAAKKIRADSRYCRRVTELGELYLADGAVRSMNVRLAKEFAGAEIMARLLGVSQLPLAHNIQLEEMLLELSRSLVLN